MRSAKIRIKSMIKALKREYPNARTALKHKSHFQLLVSTILAAQCTDKRVNRIAPHLFKKYKGPKAFAAAKQKELENDVRSTGFYRNKSKNIIASSKKIIKDFNGKVPDSMEELIALPGVARKTANIILSSCFNKAEGIAVDTHVKRLSQRMGFTKHSDPVKIEKDLMQIVPKSEWLDFNYIMVDHGRAICMARKPLCPKCAVKKLCPSAKKFYK